MNSPHLDVLIVGAGPIGIEMAVACARNNLNAVVLEAGQIGNTISWWAPQTRWFSSNDRISIAGVPLETTDQTKATREQYLTYLRTIIRQFRLQVHPYSRVESITRNVDGIFNAVYQQRSESHCVSARYVVLATGGTDRPNKLCVPGEDLPHVDGYFREPHRYFQRRIVVVGGRNSAVEAALRAYHSGADVTIVYRGADLPRESIKYWLLPEIDGLIRSGSIRAHFESIVTRITPTHVHLQKQCLNGPSIKSTDKLTIPADDVLALVGYQQDKTLFTNCGVELIGESQHPCFDESTMMTNVRGLFVAGTAIAGTQSSKYRIFLENCHVHIDRIISNICGKNHANVANRIRSHESAEFYSQIEAMPEA